MMKRSVARTSSSSAKHNGNNGHNHAISSNGNSHTVNHPKSTPPRVPSFASKLLLPFHNKDKAKDEDKPDFPQAPPSNSKSLTLLHGKPQQSFFVLLAKAFFGAAAIAWVFLMVSSMNRSASASVETHMIEQQPSQEVPITIIQQQRSSNDKQAFLQGSRRREQEKITDAAGGSKWTKKEKKRWKQEKKRQQQKEQAQVAGAAVDATPKEEKEGGTPRQLLTNKQQKQLQKEDKKRKKAAAAAAAVATNPPVPAPTAPPTAPPAALAALIADSHIPPKDDTNGDANTPLIAVDGIVPGAREEEVSSMTKATKKKKKKKKKKGVPPAVGAVADKVHENVDKNLGADGDPAVDVMDTKEEDTETDKVDTTDKGGDNAVEGVVDTIKEKNTTTDKIDANVDDNAGDNPAEGVLVAKEEDTATITDNKKNKKKKKMMNTRGKTSPATAPPAPPADAIADVDQQQQQGIRDKSNELQTAPPLLPAAAAAATVKTADNDKDKPKIAYAWFLGGIPPLSQPDYHYTPALRPVTTNATTAVKNYHGLLYNILVSVKTLQQSGSRADFMLLVHMADPKGVAELPPTEAKWLHALGIQVMYVPTTPNFVNEFTTVSMEKFRILDLIDYARVLYMDPDITPRCNMDYLMELSLPSSSSGSDTPPVLQPNWIVSIG